MTKVIKGRDNGHSCVHVIMGDQDQGGSGHRCHDRFGVCVWCGCVRPEFVRLPLIPRFRPCLFYLTSYYYYYVLGT